MSVRFAWPSYLKPWSVWLSEMRIDGRDETDRVDATRRRVRLDQAGDWETATFEVTASSDEAPPSGVASVTAFAVVSSSRANTRLPFALPPVDPSVSDRFSGTITITRAALAGACDLTVDIGGDVDDRRRLVGVGDKWDVIVDPADAPTPPGKPPFDSAWIDFADTTSPLVARQQPEAYAVMDLTGVKPTLLLNAGIDGLKELLLPATARQERKRLRDIIGSSIARDATAALVRAAANEVVPMDPEVLDPQEPQDGLLRQVCEAVAGEMTMVASAGEFYERLLDAARGSAVDQAQLWAEVDAAVDRMTGHSSAVASVVRDVKYV